MSEPTSPPSLLAERANRVERFLSIKVRLDARYLRFVAARTLS